MEIGKISWQSPSNIAIVKYWGKRDLQIPLNPSLSFTLDRCNTITNLDYKSGNGKINFLYEGQENAAFAIKVIKFIDTLNLEFLSHYDIIIDSVNNFPHSAGIASSASSMSALSLCLTDLERKFRSSEIDFLKTASTRSRMGSGSACRSVYPIAAIWGQFIQNPLSSNNYALDWSNEIHEEFKSLNDWIMIVDKAEKPVSSSAGHTLMINHPYRNARIIQARKNIVELIEALSNGHWDNFIRITEEEALSLHALMMSSSPGYILLEPESLHIIKSIQRLRSETHYPIAFTIDAGPNIHILFPDKYSEFMKSWLKAEYGNYVSHDRIIFDKIGLGPKKLQ
ncbi:MAG: diphosphomevalonate decarboxylase [Saprospiraceae bacterium]